MIAPFQWHNSPKVKLEALVGKHGTLRRMTALSYRCRPPAAAWHEHWKRPKLEAVPPRSAWALDGGPFGKMFSAVGLNRLQTQREWGMSGILKLPGGLRPTLVPTSPFLSSKMRASMQRQLVLTGSLGLTMLLLGGLLGGVVIWRSAREQMQAPEFLQMQLDRVSLQSERPGAGSLPHTEAALVRAGVAERKTIQPQKPIIGRLVEVRKVTVNTRARDTSYVSQTIASLA